MSILVSCPGCKKSFNVDEKFAGKTGPCPHCKTKITVPQKQPEVKVHAPDEFAGGGKSRTGKLLLKPIARQEAKITLLRIAGVAVGAVAAIAYAVAIRMIPIKQETEALRLILCGAGLLAIAPPLAAAAYAFLRDAELEPFRGTQLWIRAGHCGLIYALLWGIFAYVRGVVFKDTPIELFMWLFIAPPFFVIGGMSGKFSFDLDTANGFFHYAFYVVVAIVLGLVAGVSGTIWA